MAEKEKDKKAAGVKAEEKATEAAGIKEIAKAAGITPREARSVLRKLNVRPEGDKRSRWVFPLADVPKVAAKVKEHLAQKKAKAEAEAKAG